MGKFKKGLPWINFEKFSPNLFLNEKKENLIKWILRGLTIFGILTSLVTLNWYFSFSLAVFLVLLNAFIEKTIFYYTSLYVNAMPTFKYEPDKWIANSFLSMGHPKDPRSNKIVGLVFNDKRYAENLFNLFRDWNHGNSDNKDKNFNLTFVTDEDAYYVYLYPSFKKKSITKMHRKVKNNNKLKKYGKEHLGLIMSFILCKKFSTRHGYGLGMFVDIQPNNKPFLLAAFSPVEGGNPEAIKEIEPITMYAYKSVIPSELTDNDFEFIHWHSTVKRTSIGS
jgi:hypothetical protein